MRDWVFGMFPITHFSRRIDIAADRQLNFNDIRAVDINLAS